MAKKLYCIILALVLIGFAPHPLFGRELDWLSIGLRGGVNDSRNDEDFEQYEGFIIWSLPFTSHVGINFFSPIIIVLVIACSTCPMAFFMNIIQA